jgi:AcrR family transcriptional regulator
MPRGLARDHAEKRDALRRGAAAHFAAQGYDRASMASVAAACGMSKASIYHYYDSKEALLFDLLREHLSSLAQVIDQAGREGSPEDRLRDTIRAILLEYEDADDAHKVQLETLDTLPKDKRDPLVAHARHGGSAWRTSRSRRAVKSRRQTARRDDERLRNAQLVLYVEPARARHGPGRVCRPRDGPRAAGHVKSLGLRI